MAVVVGTGFWAKIPGDRKAIPEPHPAVVIALLGPDHTGRHRALVAFGTSGGVEHPYLTVLPTPQWRALDLKKTTYFNLLGVKNVYCDEIEALGTKGVFPDLVTQIRRRLPL